MARNQALKHVMERCAERRGMTMAQIAAALHMTPSGLSKKLSGSRGISLDDACALAAFIGISVDAFLSLEALYELVR